MTPKTKLRRLFNEILDELSHNPGFAGRLDEILGNASKEMPRRSNRRPPAPINPYLFLAQSEEALRSELEKLDIEQVKDIIAEHGMDAARLAMKWKTKSRLIDFVVAATAHRAEKGSAFRH